jgi:hypothetical protein
MDDLLAEFEQPKERTQGAKERRRRLVATAGIVGLSVIALGSLSTGAFFTDQTSVDSADITTGSVKINTNPTTAATLDFAATNMAPGDSAYKKLQVLNDGSLALRYSADGSASAALGGQLEVTVYMLPTAATACTAGSVAALTPLFAPAPLGTGPTQLFGNPATGADTGDQVLSAGSQDGLCIVATLPTTTGNAFQDTTTTLSFHFDAEQTANNP